MANCESVAPEIDWSLTGGGHILLFGHCMIDIHFSPVVCGHGVGNNNHTTRRGSLKVMSKTKMGYTCTNYMDEIWPQYTLIPYSFLHFFFNHLLLILLLELSSHTSNLDTPTRSENFQRRRHGILASVHQYEAHAGKERAHGVFSSLGGPSRGAGSEWTCLLTSHHNSSIDFLPLQD